jgi:hypothetical protein
LRLRAAKFNPIGDMRHAITRADRSTGCLSGKSAHPAQLTKLWRIT